MKFQVIIFLLLLQSSKVLAVTLNYKTSFDFNLESRDISYHDECNRVSFENPFSERKMDIEKIDVSRYIYNRNFSKYKDAARVLRDADNKLENESLDKGPTSLVSFHQNGFQNSRVAKEIEEHAIKEEYRVNQFLCKLTTSINECLSQNPKEAGYKRYECSKSISKDISSLIESSLKETPRAGVSGLKYGGRKFSNSYEKGNPGAEWYQLENIGTFVIDFKNKFYGYQSDHKELFNILGIGWLNCESSKKCEINID